MISPPIIQSHENRGSHYSTELKVLASWAHDSSLESGAKGVIMRDYRQLLQV